MATVLNKPERQVNLRVSWDTYERLLAEHESNSAVRFTYNRGELEILVPSVEHEMLTSAVETLVETLAHEMNIDFQRTRSTTFQRQDLERGFETDSSFYFRAASQVRRKKRLDLTKDPVPELVIEIDVTNESMNKFPIYAAFAIPEVWRYSAAAVSIWTLKRNKYVAQLESAIFPNVTASDLTALIQLGQELERPSWINRIRDWAHRRV
jgi:Uma2 family endonuclease